MKTAITQRTRLAARRLRLWPLARRLTAALALWLLLCGPAISAEAPAVLRAGIAKTDITPAKPVMLAGYASRKELSQGVHDPLSARVVAFEQDGKRLVLVSTDLIGFYGETAESMRKAILAACGLQPSELFLTAIHTHSAPERHARTARRPRQQRRVHQDARNATGRRRARGAGPHGPGRDRGRVRLVSGRRQPAGGRAGRRREDQDRNWAAIPRC